MRFAISSAITISRKQHYLYNTTDFPTFAGSHITSCLFSTQTLSLALQLAPSPA